MADKTEKQHDLGVLEEDDEFEEFPAEDWKVWDRNMIFNRMFFVKNIPYRLLIINNKQRNLKLSTENFISIIKTIKAYS